MKTVISILILLSINSVSAQKFMRYYENTYGLDEIKGYYADLNQLSIDSLKNIISDVPLTLSIWKLSEEYMGQPKTDTVIVDYKKLLGYLAYFILEKKEKATETDLFYLAWIKKQNGDHEEAIFDLTKCLKGQFSEDTFPSISQIYTNRGECKFELGDLYGAIADLSESLELDSENPNNFQLRGRTYGRLNKFPEAVSDFTRSIELKPDDSKTFYYRAIAFEAMQQTEKACLDLSRAGELGLSGAYQIIKEICK